METTYVDMSGGQWELFCYAEGRRVFLAASFDLAKLESLCRLRGYRPPVVIRNLADKLAAKRAELGRV